MLCALFLRLPGGSIPRLRRANDALCHVFVSLHVEVTSKHSPQFALELPCALPVADWSMTSVPLQHTKERIAGPLIELDADASLFQLGEVREDIHCNRVRHVRGFGDYRCISGLLWSDILEFRITYGTYHPVELWAPNSGVVLYQSSARVVRTSPRDRTGAISNFRALLHEMCTT